MLFGLEFNDTFDVTAIATAAAAAGTVGALIAALVQLRNERAARKQIETADRTAKTREQAEQVSAWLAQQFVAEAEKTPIELLNSSSQPVYGLVLYVVNIQGAGEQTGRAIEESYQAQ